MKIIILTIGLLLSFTNANAITDRNEYFTSSCEEQLGVALMWKDYTWNKARVTKDSLSKYVAKKIKSTITNDEEMNLKAGSCGYELDEKYLSKWQKKRLKNKQKDWESNKKVVIWDACYNIREFGESFYNDDTQICSEVWVNNYGTYELKEIKCEDVGFYDFPFYFSPDGWFHTAQISSDVRDYPDPKSNIPTKDPMSITVGKCSTL